ncbi:CDP-glycerol:glycerophosphate glycerophosphotransferase [Methanobrevibacter sp.]
MSKFKFTIITAFYNTGDYLKESIESVIGQDIGFEDNVQLILVDDGSVDNSIEIALSYQKIYPNNILVLSKENGGVATARNLGLKHIEGEFVNFLDSDDKFSKDSLSVIDRFLKENEDIDIVAMPLIYFDKKTGEHHLNYKFETERIIDLTKDYDYPHAHISSSFIRYDVLKNYKFNENLVNGSDLLFMNEILIDVKKYGVTNKTHYNYRKRFDESSIMDNAKKSKRFFTEKMKLCYKHLFDLSIEKYGHVLDFIQYIVALDLNGIITSKVYEEIFDNQKEIDEFWDCLMDLLSYIDEDIIRTHRYLNFNTKSFCIYLKNDDFYVEINPRRNKVFLKSKEFVINRLHNHKIYFDFVEIKDNQLHLAGCLISKSINDSISFNAIKKTPDGNETVYKCRRVDYPTTNRKTWKLLGIKWKFYYNFEVSIPITDENYKISFNLHFEENGDYANLKPEIDFKEYCNISEFSNYFVKDGKIVLFKDNAFHVVNYTHFFRFKQALKSVSKILSSDEENKYYSIYIRILHMFHSLFFRNKRVWLFSDRPTVADDNAKYLFEYSVKQDDNIEKYYIVDNQTDYFNQMREIDKNIVAWGSLKHKLLYLVAEKIITSHVNHEWINPFKEENQKLFLGLTTVKKCFLQHGITLHDASAWIKTFYHNFFLFVTASDLERDSIINGDYNYSEDVVQTLGFPRYDNLTNNKGKKQILFMPTWRKYLKDDESFKSSEYFEFINNFFNNEKILKLARDNGYKIIFKPHFDLIPFIDLFDIPSEITVGLNESYQDLFNESSILITDYSSVFFDFAYLKKPIIYYRGEDEFHYEESYFNFETMGFGEIVYSEEVLFDKINSYIENDCEMEDEYKNRVNKFFKFNDQNNSKRVYEWLLNHKG